MNETKKLTALLGYIHRGEAGRAQLKTLKARIAKQPQQIEIDDLADWKLSVKQLTVKS